MDDILEFLNKKIREEHGNRVRYESSWGDSDLDSFGSTMVFFELDSEYGCFDKDWLSSVKGTELTVKDIVDRILDARKVV